METHHLQPLLDIDDPVTTLLRIAAEYPGKVSFSTSFGLEDQVVTHLIFSNNLPIRVFTLDTGRLFEETYRVWDETVKFYGKEIDSYYPNCQHVEQMVTAKGPYSFYESVENRKECCHIRKVEPLNRALEGTKVWVTGIRATQSENRQDMQPLEKDAQRGLVKYHPIFNWTFDQVQNFVKYHHIPYNKLHDKGYPSIGCQPCTRAVRPGEDFRAGRWWWEDKSKKECGLHARN